MNHTNKNWFALFTTNFLGIFNDNFLKHCIIFIGVTWHLPDWLSQSQLISMVSAALVIPYLILSPLAGRWSVIYSKKKILRIFKMIELPIMITASFAFYFQLVWLAVLAVFIMGLQSCMYSPAKYGLIRDVGGQEGVSFGSGVFETMAFLGILIGTVAASYLSDHYNVYILIALFLGVALAGYFTSTRINAKELPEEKDNISTVNPVKFIIDSYKFARNHKYVNSGVLGASVFWLLGGMLQMNMVIHCVNTLKTSNTVAGLVMAGAAVGIALGCTTAGLIAGKKVRHSMIPIGLLGMIASILVIIIFNPPVLICGILVFVLAFMGGIFEVPCLAIVQNADLGRKLGDIIGYLNIITFVFVLLGTVLFSLTTLISNDNSIAVFGVILAICILTLLYYIIRYPEFLRKSKG